VFRKAVQVDVSAMGGRFRIQSDLQIVKAT
jgi:hypothetical protein